jgi:hypothetical protein
MNPRQIRVDKSRPGRKNRHRPAVASLADKCRHVGIPLPGYFLSESKADLTTNAAGMV